MKEQTPSSNAGNQTGKPVRKLRRFAVVGSIVLAVVVILIAILAFVATKQTKIVSKSAPITKESAGSQADTCSGNSPDICVMAPSVDLYPAGSEGATNPEYVKLKDGVWHSIGGTVTSAAGKQLQLKTSSGRTVTVNFPVEIATWWNSQIGPNYGNYQFGVGDTIRVDYEEKSGTRSNTIEPSQIVHSAIAIDHSSVGSSAIKRYPKPVE